tara:strand:+ start:1889 stop:3349 length:1461 start_codon:yes stop_codon:yes gene_type:complete
MAVILPIISEFNAKGTQKAIKEFQSLEGAGKKAQFALKKAALPAALALGAVTAAAAGMLKAGEAAATSNARIAQINESMGLFGAETEKVNDRLFAYANATARATGIDQNSIKATQAKLLTFGALAKSADELNGAFDRATTAAIDLASAGFGDAESNAVQLGKALQDPIKGIAALAKSGVSFTAQEKEKIKTLVETNRTLEAQDLILQAIEKQVGGTALATANDTDKLKVAFSQVSESIGLILVPILAGLAPILTSIADLGSRNAKIFVIVAGVIAAVAVTILALNAAMKVYAAGQMIVNGIVAVFNAILLANPVTLVILAIVAFIAILAALYFKFEVVRKVVDTVFKGMLAGGKAVFDGLSTYFSAVFNIYKNLFNGIAKLWNNTVGKLSFKIPSWVPLLGGNGFSVPNIPMLADGGIVTNPTLAMIGERGPEAVIPLSGRNSGMGGNYTINITGGLGSSAEIGTAVVNAIRAFNRTNGPANIQVA